MGYNLGVPGEFAPTFQYDPSTGTYMAFDYSCMPMQEQMLPVEERPEEHTQALLSQLSEKLGEDQIQVSGEMPLEQPLEQQPGEELALAGNGDVEGWEGNWEGGSWGQNV